MTRTILAGLLALAAASCGVAAPAPSRFASLPVTAAGKGAISGAYLSVDIRPNDQLLGTARSLRRELQFLDMGQAVPPRKADVYHATVGYFRALGRHSANQMARAYQGRPVTLELTGWGVAQGRAAYFTVSGIEPLRQQLKAMKVDPFTADDAHITFGVSPGARRDVHGVPKPPQHTLPAMALTGELHLKQGGRTLW